MNHIFRFIMVWILTAPLCYALGEDSVYTGSDSCASCHIKETSDWKSSHHSLAMSDINDDKNLGSFDGEVRVFLDRQVIFFHENGKYFISETRYESETRIYPVIYSLGYYPLQQYIVDIGSGHLQVFDIAWDARSKDQGGQRWFLANPDQSLGAEVELAWDGTFMNWNSRCASCHTTDFKRNYLPADNSYQSKWLEVGVGCEACHGPASNHLLWAEGEAEKKHEQHKGFLKPLRKSLAWSNEEDKPLSSIESDSPTNETQICFNCHARRQQLIDESSIHDFSDSSQIRLLEPDLYFPDGQIKDEVFIAGSFMQSKMYAAGVVCSDCHDPHSNKLKHQQNTLCTQCHNKQLYDSVDHHSHPEGEGSECINCHMPVRRYMGVDDRRDHGFQVPDPILSAKLGTPTVCTDCHSQANDPEWMKEKGINWHKDGGNKTLRFETASLLSDIWDGQPPANWKSKLKDILEESSSPFIKASIIAAGPSAIDIVMVGKLLKDESPLVQVSALRLIHNLEPTYRLKLVKPLLESSYRSVRIEAVKALLDLEESLLDKSLITIYKSAEKEYQIALDLNKDTPMGLVEIANYHRLKRNFSESEINLKKSLAISPSLLIASINLADLYREIGNQTQSIETLLSAIKYHQENYILQYSLGMAYVRTKEHKKAILSLRNAYTYSNRNADIGHALVIALSSYNRFSEAKNILEEMLEKYPDDVRFISLKRRFIESNEQ